MAWKLRPVSYCLPINVPIFPWHDSKLLPCDLMTETTSSPIYIDPLNLIVVGFLSLVHCIALLTTPIDALFCCSPCFPSLMRYHDIFGSFHFYLTDIIILVHRLNWRGTSTKMWLCIRKLCITTGVTSMPCIILGLHMVRCLSLIWYV